MQIGVGLSFSRTMSLFCVWPERIYWMYTDVIAKRSVLKISSSPTSIYYLEPHGKNIYIDQATA